MGPPAFYVYNAAIIEFAYLPHEAMRVRVRGALRAMEAGYG